MQEYNIEKLISGDRRWGFKEEDKSELLLLTGHPCWKAYQKVIQALSMLAIDATLANTNGQTEFNRGKASAYIELQRELSSLKSKLEKKKVKEGKEKN